MENSPTSCRPRCSVFIATSLDGFIARLDGSIDWLQTVASPGEDYGYQTFFDSIDTLVIGRNTYDAVRSFPSWPYAGKRCVVLTHRPMPAAFDEEFSVEDPVALLARLGRGGARHVYVDGGQVIRQFLTAKAIDELTLSTIPILLGVGVPLFGGLGEFGLALEQTRSWPTGLVQSRYRIR
jgi:dihydrofolate reductase